MQHLQMEIENANGKLDKQALLYNRIAQTVFYQVEALKDQGRALQDLERTMIQLEDGAELMVRDYELMAKHGIDVNENLETRKEKVREILEFEREQYKEAVKFRDTLQEQEEVFQNINNTWKQTSEFFGTSDTWKNNPFLSMFQNLKKDNFFEQLKLNILGATSGFAEMMTVGNAAGSMFQKLFEGILEYAFEQDEAIKKFQQLTGASRMYSEEIETVYRSTMKYGVEVGEASQAMADLYNEMPGFINLEREIQIELGNHAAMLDKLGISSNTTAKLFGFMTKSFGMNASEVKEVTLDLIATGQVLGVSAEDMISSFNDALPALAVYGRRAHEVFSDAMIVARGLGLELQNLLDLHEKFDTFEKAAESVGQLNAILGGSYLNAIDMVMQKDPTQRFLSLRRAINDAGMSFENLSYYEQKAVAAALEMPVGVVQKMMGSPSDINIYLSKQKEMQGNQEKFNEAIMNAVPIATQWLALMRQFGQSIRPIIDVLEDIIKKVNELFVWFDKTFGAFGNVFKVGLLMALPILGSIAVHVLKTMVLTKLLNSRLISMSQSLTMTFSKMRDGVASTTQSVQEVAKETIKSSRTIGNVAPQVNKMEKSMQTGGKAMSKFALNAVALGIAFVGVGAGIYFASNGLSNLAIAVGNMKDNAGAFVAVVGILMAGFIGLGFAILAAGKMSMAAAVPMLAIGAAILMIGGAVALAGYGISMIINSFSNLVVSIKKGADSLLTASYGIAALSISMAALGASLLLIKTDDLNALSILFLNVSKIGNGTAEAISGISKNIRSMVIALNEIDDVDKSIEFIAAIRTKGIIGPSAVFEEVSNEIVNTNKIVRATSNISNSNATLRTTNDEKKDTDAIVAAIMIATKAIANQKFKNTILEISLDSEKIAEAIMPQVQEFIENKLSGAA